MTLELICQDPNPQFLINKDIKKGIAKHIIGDIDYWVERVKQARTKE
jgi:hypothetical protein